MFICFAPTTKNQESKISKEIINRKKKKKRKKKPIALGCWLQILIAKHFFLCYGTKNFAD
jgi:hypothetical protein